LIDLCVAAKYTASDFQLDDAFTGDPELMTSQYTRTISKGITLFTVVCVLRIAMFAGAPFSVKAAEPGMPVPQTAGTFKSTNNQAIIVNGNNVKPGTTILSGADIETPAGVGATFQLGPSTLRVSPDSALVVEFTANLVKVTLKRGCIILSTPGSATGIIILPNGSTVTTSDKHDADVCVDRAGTPVVNQGAASNAGAGAGTGGGVPSSAGGISPAIIALLIGGGVAITAALLIGRGNNPSPSTP
jgi:hypothetical protein